MKITKYLTIGLFVLGLGIMTSCKKDWTCTCKGTMTTPSPTGGSISTQYYNKMDLQDMKKSKAKSKCKDWENSTNSSSIFNVSCSI